MSGPGPREVRFEVDAGPRAPGVARRRVLEVVAPWDGVDLDAVALLTSELVTNVVLHADVPAEVTVVVGVAAVRVEVSDAHPGRPELRSAGPEAVTGRGLQIVDALADRWGVRQGADSAAGRGAGDTAAKTVWFELDRQATR